MLKTESKRINLLEEGNDIDLSHLAIEGAGLKELFRIMAELKTEILQKSASKDQIRTLEWELNDLKQKSSSEKKSNFDIELREEI